MPLPLVTLPTTQGGKHKELTAAAALLYCSTLELIHEISRGHLNTAAAAAQQTERMRGEGTRKMAIGAVIDVPSTALPICCRGLQMGEEGRDADAVWKTPI